MMKVLAAATAVAAMVISAACSHNSSPPPGLTADQQDLNKTFKTFDSRYNVADPRLVRHVKNVNVDRKQSNSSKNGAIVSNIDSLGFVIGFDDKMEMSMNVSPEDLSSLQSGKEVPLKVTDEGEDETGTTLSVQQSVEKDLNGAISAKAACLDSACGRIGLLIELDPKAPVTGKQTAPPAPWFAGYIFKRVAKGYVLEATEGPAVEGSQTPTN